MMLRSNSSVPKEKLVPVCIAYNSAHHTYRFENSASGCVGTHAESSTSWVHVSTMHTSSDATGDSICVGLASEGQRTRWMMKKAQNCDVEGYQHKFSFKTMQPKLPPTIVASCLFVAETKDGGHTVMRITINTKPGSGCQKQPADEPGLQSWIMQKELSLLARRLSKSDHRLCIATASTQADGTKGVEGELVRGWRLLKDKACDHPQHNSVEKAKEGDISVTWKVHSTPKAYVPADASGTKICVCRAADGSPAKELLQYTLSQLGSCSLPRSQEDFCFRTLSGEDLIKASYLLDEPM